METSNRPFTGSTEAALRFESAPLALVLAQIRWPQLGALAGNFKAKSELIGSLIANDYPMLNVHQEVQVSVDQNGVQEHAGQTIYTWSTVDSSWQVTFAQSYLTLQTSNYDGLDDFSARLSNILTFVNQAVDIPVVDRIGFRYSNRIVEFSDLNQLSEFFDLEKLGGSPSANINESSVKLLHNTFEARYQVENRGLLVRTANLPANAVVDQAIIPVNGESWILDIDASIEARVPYDMQKTLNEVRALSDLGYDFFRSAIKPSFVNRFKGVKIDQPTSAIKSEC